MIKDPHVQCFITRMVNKGILTGAEARTFVERAEMLEEEEERDKNAPTVRPPSYSEQTANAYKVRYKPL